MSKTCFQNARKCVFLGVILQNFPGSMSPPPPRMVVPSALPLKLICDVTRLWRNLVSPLGNFLRTPLITVVHQILFKSVCAKIEPEKSSHEARATWIVTTSYDFKCTMAGNDIAHGTESNSPSKGRNGHDRYRLICCLVRCDFYKPLVTQKRLLSSWIFRLLHRSTDPYHLTPGIMIKWLNWAKRACVNTSDGCRGVLFILLISNANDLP